MPDEPEYDNPIIPEDPNFIAPETTILTGPIDGTTVDDHTVTFTWTGNEDVVEYCYRMGTSDWSAWDMETTTTYEYLDEGSYHFEVAGRYASLIEDTTAASVNFTIDAIHGPALWLYPRYQEVASGESFTVEVMLEDVVDVMAVKAVLAFDPAQMQVSSIIIYDDADSLMKSNGGELIQYQSIDKTNGAAIIEAVLATGNPPSISGTGAIAQVTFVAIQPGDITFGAATSLRDPDNGEIAITETPLAKVEVR